MSISIAAATGGCRRQKPQLCTSRPPYILLNSAARICRWPNTTTAVGEGRDNMTIEASLLLARPPHPSRLFVHCPRMSFPRVTEILVTAKDLILFSVPVAVGPPPRYIKSEDCDYIIYRAGDGGTPSLTRVPDPKSILREGYVGLLSRGNQFTVASLHANNNVDEYTLHRFDSEIGNWTQKVVSLEAPRKRYLRKIPPNAYRLNYHITTAVITLGGEAGTMGWVDLWSGILLYDLLHDEDHTNRSAVLRYIPLPWPRLSATVNELACPRPFRGITSVVRHGEPCLKLVGLEIVEQILPYDDIETGFPCYKVDDWSITTWINTKMGDSGSLEDWQEDFTVWASKITISEAVRSKLLASGLLHHKPSYIGDKTVELGLQNLAVSNPTPSLNGDEDVIFLMARPKHFYLKAWALAIEMKNCTLLDVSEFGIDEVPGYPDVRGCPSDISNYV